MFKRSSLMFLVVTFFSVVPVICQAGWYQDFYSRGFNKGMTDGYQDGYLTNIRPATMRLSEALFPRVRVVAQPLLN